MTEPQEFIRIQPLANGFRIDVVGNDPATGEQRKLDSLHYPTRELADRFAEMLQQSTGFTIIEGDAK